MMKHENIIKILSEEKANSYHSAILTSYSFDPFFFSSIIVPRLNRLGIRNIILHLDSSKYDEMLSNVDSLRFLDKESYTVIRKKSRHGGVFHPKISMLLGADNGLLICGSGNLTINGYARNHEIWGVYSRQKSKDTNDNLLKSVWNYLEDINDKSSTVANQQMQWAYESTPWLMVAKEQGIIDGGNRVTFIANKSGQSTGEQIKGIIGADTKIDTIRVVSPFYDTNGCALDDLYATYHPQEFHCTLEEGGTMPSKCRYEPSMQFSSIKSTSLYLKEKSAFVHAKMVQFEAKNKTFLYIGSANLTKNGWGYEGQFSNDEAGFLISSDKAYNFMKLDLKIHDGDHKTLFGTGKSKISEDALPEKTYEIEILSAELLGDKLSLEVATNKTNSINYRLSLFDINGDLLQSIPYEIGINTIKIQYPAGLFYVAITMDNMEISNRCIPLDMGAILKNNPTSTNQKLKGLLDIDEIDENMIKLLNIVSECFFCNVNNDERVKIFLKKYKESSEKEGVTILPDEYDNLLFKGTGGFNRSNIELAEVFKDITSYWNSIDDELSDDDNIEETDDVLSEKDDPEKRPSRKGSHEESQDLSQSKPEIWSRNCKAIIKFMNKVYEHFKGLNQNSPEAKAGQSADLQNLATVAIVSCLVNFMITRKSKISNEAYDLKYQYVCMMSMFLCSVRYPCENQDINIRRKREELHRTFFVNSLLIMLQTNRYVDETFNDKEVVTLNCLNLFESYKLYNNGNIDESFAEFMGKAGDLLLEDNYLYGQIVNSFTKWKDIQPNLKQITKNMIGTEYLIYTKRYGYMMVSISSGGNNFNLHRENFSYCFNKPGNFVMLCGELGEYII